MKIKRLAAIVLTAVMVLSCSMTAFAAVNIDGEEMTETHKKTETGVEVTYNPTSSGGAEVTIIENSNDPQWVSVDKAGEVLYISYNDVTGDLGGTKPTISSSTTDYTPEKPASSGVVVSGNVGESQTQHAVVANQHGPLQLREM